MESCLMLSTLFTILIVLSNVKAQAPAALGAGGGGDITTFGAKPGADSAQAITTAWKEACAAAGTGTVTVPTGTFLTGPVLLAGPCKGEMKFNLIGTLQAPLKVETSGWITFEHVDKLTISGTGTLDGQGEEMWKSQPGCFKTAKMCKTTAINLRLDFVKTGLVEGITSLNSKNFHINVLSSTDITLQKLTITAPAESPNTDGIHVARSKGVTITDVNIGTGDDCVSVGDRTSDLKVINVKCGPGHGISIGSLGLYQNEEPVTGVTVQGCTLTKSDNGVRVKSWPDKYGCEASGIHFSDITMEEVENPIIIDMMYCPPGGCSTTAPSKVKLTDISFKGIKGSTPTPDAISINCMLGSCTNIGLADIDLKFTGPKGPPIANCTNIKPTMTGTVNPAGC
ncbi:exopolygalacturonase-like [Euphorbia lathyris]|uniref:exopolygalacturonase-like n=1 Tax=Euphorbia lathyris TaxID=212925 RepID=UPI003313CAFE